MKAKIAVITPNTLSHRTSEETLALGYLTAVLRADGYPVVIVDGWLRNISPNEIIDLIGIDEFPAVICLSCYRSNLEQAKEILHLAKQKFGDVPVICGGYGPTFHADDFLDAGFTVAVQGEAELIISSLVSAVISKQDFSEIRGISYRKNRETKVTPRIEPTYDLDQIPFPARDELRFSISRKNPVHICTSRGCEAHCLFCSIFAFALGGSKNRRWRYRSIQNIVEEIRALHEEFGVTHFKFVDDSFIEPPRDEKWVEEFSEAIRNLDFQIKFRTQVRADRLSRSIVKNLSEVGWFATSIGVENASPDALSRMGKTASVEDNAYALELLNEFGVYAQMGLILFDHKTTISELEENYRFLAHHSWVVTKGIFTEMFAADGTVFTRNLGRNGLLLVDQNQQQNNRYEVLNPSARRVYDMLKTWHKSHSQIYDWIIDSISAPKVLPEEGYKEVHSLSSKLLVKDVWFLRTALDQISQPEANDTEVTRNAIETNMGFYILLEQSIAEIYHRYGLIYDGVKNPFII